MIRITDVRAVPGDSAFLLDDGQTSILYDSGFAFTGFSVADKIKEVLGERELDYIFLTHSHYDHVLGSVYVAQRYPKARIIAGEYAAGIFQKDSAKSVMRELDHKFAVKSGVGPYEDLIDCLRVDIPVSDGDLIRAGDLMFRVINLPGHTKCSVGFYLESEKLLLGTETIGVYDGNGDVVPSYLVGYAMTLASISRVQELEVNRILVPHFGILEKEETVRYLKQARRTAVETKEFICENLSAGKTNQEIIEKMKQRFWHGYIRTIYPVDAMELNSNIMIELIRRECLERYDLNTHK